MFGKKKKKKKKKGLTSPAVFKAISDGKSQFKHVVCTCLLQMVSRNGDGVVLGHVLGI